MALEDPDIEQRTPAMARSFDRLRDIMNPEARERVDQRVRDALREMTLQELRRNASDKTQTE